MKNFNISALTFAIGLTFSVGVMAETMSKPQYKAHAGTIEAEYKTAKIACNSAAGNANDICIAEAKGKKNVAKAELEASYQPSVKTRYDARVASADAVYSVAIEKCDDKAGNDKDVCVKEAKATKVHQLADAKAKRTTSEANAEANQASTEANKNAESDKRDADYTVAKEKCNSMAGNAKDMCMNEAKTRFDK